MMYLRKIFCRCQSFSRCYYRRRIQQQDEQRRDEDAGTLPHGASNLVYFSYFEIWILSRKMTQSTIS